VLLLGLGLFSLASLACALAGNIDSLLLLRLLQGVAAGAAAALPAAIVRDVFTGHAALSRQSYVALVNAVAPLLAPLLGAGLLAFGSWRLIYGCLGVIGLVLLGLGALGWKPGRRKRAPRMSCARRSRLTARCCATAITWCTPGCWPRRSAPCLPTSPAPRPCSSTCSAYRAPAMARCLR
jgi:MFS family permease